MNLWSRLDVQAGAHVDEQVASMHQLGCTHAAADCPVASLLSR